MCCCSSFPFLEDSWATGLRQGTLLSLLLLCLRENSLFKVKHSQRC